MVAAARPGRRHSPILPAPGGCLLVVFEHCLVDSTGRVVDEWLFPFAVTDVRLRRPPSGMRAFARSLARTIADRLGPHAEHAARQRAADAGSHLAAARGAMRARLLALARDADDTGTAPPAQPGLFDRRTEHDAERALAKDAAWVAMRRRHAGADASAAEFRARPPQLKWVFVQWPSSPPVPRMTTRG